jgi:hypothetical protein
LGGALPLHIRGLLFTVGTVVGGILTCDSVFLQQHNEELHAQGKAQFILPQNLKPSALDWLIFEAEPAR